MPKISVIIPSYNAEKTIKKCIDSIINQNFPDVEIICVDDNSNDNTISILKEYQQKYNIIIKNSTGKGAGRSRNIGMDCASGEYLYFLDSDDFLAENALNTMYSNIVKNDADILIFNYYQNNVSNNVIKNIYVSNNNISNNLFNAKDIPNDILCDFKVFVWNKLFKTSFIRKNNIRFQEILRTNDIYFVRCAMLMAEKIYYLDDYLIYYSIGQTTNVQNNNYKVPTEFTKSLFGLKNFLLEQNIYSLYKKSFLKLAIEEINSAQMSLKSHPKQYYELAKYLDKKVFKLLGIKKSDTKMWSYIKIFFVWIFSIRSYRGTGYKVLNIFGHQIWINLKRDNK